MKRNECLFTLMKLKMEHNCETKWMSIAVDEIKDVSQLWSEMNVYKHWWNYRLDTIMKRHECL